MRWQTTARGDAGKHTIGTGGSEWGKRERAGAGAWGGLGGGAEREESRHISADAHRKPGLLGFLTDHVARHSESQEAGAKGQRGARRVEGGQRGQGPVVLSVTHSGRQWRGVVYAPCTTARSVRRNAAATLPPPRPRPRAACNYPTPTTTTKLHQNNIKDVQGPAAPAADARPRVLCRAAGSPHFP